MEKSNKKAMSIVVSSVIMVALAIVIILVVWGVISSMVNEELTDTQSCFGNFGEVTINSQYTCYNASANEFQFSLSISDIDLSEAVVFIVGEGTTKSFRLTSTQQTIEHLKNYTSGTLTKLPEKNSGLTYRADLTGLGMTQAPDLVKIAPVMNGKQCEASDILNEIDLCTSLA